MSKLAWTPWHKVLQIRDDLKSGELSLAVFAADLYDVMMGKARPVYCVLLGAMTEGRSKASRDRSIAVFSCMRPPL